LLLQLLDLVPLLLDLTVLRRQFALSLGVVVVFLLHMMPHRIPAHASDTCADKCARYRMMYRSTYDCSGTSSYQGSHARALFGIGELRPRDRWYGSNYASQRDYRYPVVPHLAYFPRLPSSIELPVYLVGEERKEATAV
jgi:hypothetical protein